MKTFGRCLRMDQRTIVRFILCVGFLLCFVNITPENPFTYVTNAKVAISATKKKIVKGETKTLKVTGTTKTPKWKSSDPSIAKVNSKGKVTAVETGKCTITATVSGKAYNCAATVVYPTYDITPDSLMANGAASKNGCYYMIKSYMNEFENAGGGTLNIGPGIYRISNTIYIPSNVTIKCDPETRFEKISGSATVFGLVPPSKCKEKIYGYEGSQNVTFRGNGAVVDMKGDGMTFTMGHARDIRIENLNLYNMDKKKYHFFEINSSCNVIITDCYMEGTSTPAGKSAYSWKECINIDSDDNDGFNATWSSKDKTCCKQVMITNCTFKNANGAIGTHNYSDNGKSQFYHENITIANCTFENIGSNIKSSNTIRMMSWRDSAIKDCTFMNCTGYSEAPIRMDGDADISILGNTFVGCGTKIITTTYNSKKYSCAFSPLAVTKKYDVTNPKLPIFNTYYSDSQCKKLDIAKDSYEYFKYKVISNTVDGKALKLKKQ